MEDRIGVLKFPVRVMPVTGVALLRLKNRLDIMEREVEHLRIAVKDMKNGIARNDTRLLTSGVMNSRNWTLSVVTAHCYVQSMLGEGSSGPSGFKGQLTPSAGFQSYLLFKRASELGNQDGYRDRTMS